MHRLDDTAIRKLLDKASKQPSEELESDTVEFKEYSNASAINNSKDLPLEVSALANTSGGTIVIGVKDSSNVRGANWASQLTGIEHIDEFELKERLAGRLQPALDLSISNLSHAGKNFVVVHVPNPRDTLVSTSSGKTYLREGRSSRPMTPRELESSVKQLTTYDWSGDCIEIPALEALDLAAVHDAKADFARLRELHETPDDASYLEAIGATRNGALTKAGLLFLGKAEIIRDILGDYEYRFSWKLPNGMLRANDVWYGCLWLAIRRAHDHFDACNDEQEYRYKDKHFTVPLLDRTAFHEAYLNALVHRDYSSEGMVSVNFGNGRIVITSPGLFYGGITADNIAIHEPRHRNKELARILMSHSLVDRAGMGVLRMGLGSLRYGRSFPEFRETSDSVEVAMDAQYLKPPIAVLALDNSAMFGIPELLILNLVHERGAIPVEDLLDRLRNLSSNPWHDIKRAVDEIECVELCGTNAGVYVRVIPRWKDFMEVGRVFRPSTNSDKHVGLFSYLMRHGEASNSDLRDVLGHSHSPQTSRFLRDAKYVERRGSGPKAVWRLTK